MVDLHANEIMRRGKLISNQCEYLMGPSCFQQVLQEERWAESIIAILCIPQHTGEML